MIVDIKGEPMCGVVEFNIDKASATYQKMRLQTLVASSAGNYAIDEINDIAAITITGDAPRASATAQSRRIRASGRNCCAKDYPLWNAS